MRRLMLVAVLLLSPRLAGATPFTPNAFSVHIFQPDIALCFICNDADAGNDLHIDLHLAGWTAGWPPVFHTDALGVEFTLIASGPLPPATINAAISIPIQLELWDVADPGPHSFTYGNLGAGFGISPLEGFVMCCAGVVNGAVFSPSNFFGDNFQVPGFLHGFAHVAYPINPTFTPAEAPEPSSLLLLGSGLIALTRRRQR